MPNSVNQESDFTDEGKGLPKLNNDFEEICVKHNNLIQK